MLAISAGLAVLRGRRDCRDRRDDRDRAVLAVGWVTTLRVLPTALLSGTELLCPGLLRDAADCGT